MTDAKRGSESLEDRGDALAAADAHRYQRVPAARTVQLVERLHGDQTTGGADRMTDRDPAAVGIDLVQRQVEIPHDGERLGGEGLVELDGVEVLDLQAGAFEQ